jgi:hypothetical protein
MRRADRLKSSELSAALRIAGALAVAALLALAVLPTDVVAHGPALCLSKRLLGVECPGCGMTRALSALLHGQVAAALAFNRGAPAAFIGMLALAVFSVKELWPSSIAR